MNIKNACFIVCFILILYLFSSDSSATMKQTRLEQQAYDQMAFVDSIKIKGTLVACILLPDKTIARAKVKDYIGINQGTITKISATNIEVTELVSVNNGEWAESKIIWPLAKSSKNKYSC